MKTGKDIPTSAPRTQAKHATAEKANKPADGQREFEKLARKYFDWLMRQYPGWATDLGIHEFDNRLTDYSIKSLNERKAKVKEFHGLFKAIAAKDLDLDSRIERQLIVDALAARVTLERKWPREERDPGMFLDDGVYSCYSITIRECGDAEEAAKRMTERLRCIPKLLQQGRKLVIKPTKIDCDVAMLSGMGAISFFKDTVAKFAKRVKDAQIRQAMREAAQTAEEAVQEYLNWVQLELMPVAKLEFAFGHELFEMLLKKVHQLDIDAATLKKIGERVFEQTLVELQATANKLNSKYTWEQHVDLLKRDHPTNSELVQDYADEMKRAKRFVIEHRLVDIPEGERIDVVPTPEFARPTIPYAAYIGPAPFEREQRGVFWVTPVDRDKSPQEMEEQLRGHSRHGIVITALHEAYPGHHLQISVGNQLSSRPLRMLLGSSVFCEGWALYCEQMMCEQGFYDDDRVKLLQLKDQLWRAARVILDVALHCEGMSFDEAVAFLVEKVKIEQPNAEAEVRRYCQTPTQPMSYVVGKLQVQEILNAYRAKRAGAFNLRQFHNELLRHGTLPFKQVRQLMGLPAASKAEAGL